MADIYRNLSIDELTQKLILSTKKFVTSLENNEDWESLEALRNHIAKLNVFIELKKPT